MNKRTTKIQHRIPEPERLDIALRIRVNADTFDKLSHIAVNRNRKLSDLCRCALVSFANAEVKIG